MSCNNSKGLCDNNYQTLSCINTNLFYVIFHSKDRTGLICLVEAMHLLHNILQFLCRVHSKTQNKPSTVGCGLHHHCHTKFGVPDLYNSLKCTKINASILFKESTFLFGMGIYILPLPLSCFAVKHDNEPNLPSILPFISPTFHKKREWSLDSFPFS